MKKSTLFSAFKYIAFLSFGLALLWYVTKSQDIDALLAEFKTANYWWIALAMLAGAISHMFRAARWNLIIKPMGYQTKFSTTFAAVMIGYFANMVVPRLGEVSRCGVLNKNTSVPFNVLLGTVVAERIFDAVCLLLLSVMVIFFQFEFLSDFLTTYLFGPLSEKITGSYVAMIFLAAGFILFIVVLYVLYKMTNRRLKDKPFFVKLRRILAGFAEGIKAIKNIENKWLFIVQTVAIWIMYFFMTYLCFFSLKGTSGLSVADGFTILVMGSVGIVAPVPGGIGAYHFIVITTLSVLFLVEPATATSFAYISHTSQGVLICILALWAVIMLFLRNRKKKHDAEQHS